MHLILVPKDEPGLALAGGGRRYTAFVGARGRWTGHLFQGRFASTAMDEDHLCAALRYVALNPGKARLVERAEDWAWSSTRALIAGASDAYVDVGPALERAGDFAAFLASGAREEADEGRWERLLAAEAVGRPVGAEDWIKDLERRLGMPLAPGKRGPKPKARAEAEALDLFGALGMRRGFASRHLNYSRTGIMRSIATCWPSRRRRREP